MPKKFKQPSVDDHLPDTDMQISLLDYMRRHAVDTLNPMPMMAGSSALRFWQDHFQPMLAHEGKRLINARLDWPYAERIIYLVREFKRQEPRCQQYILKAAEQKIWWRGDEINQFRRIVTAQLHYRRLNETERINYRKQLLKITKIPMGSDAIDNAKH